MSAGLQLILSTALVAAPPGCSWANPGANPYRGVPAAVLSDFAMPDDTRARLRALMLAHRPTDVAVITRDDIVGEHGYTDLREMHSGHGKVCRGPVDRSSWSARRHERAFVYCADGVCVIVPVICNNVSLVTRKPEREAALDDGPIDIEPAAGPGPSPAPEATMLPGDFAPLLAGADPLADVAPAPGGAAPGGGLPVGGTPIGGGPCCGSEVINPFVPSAPPVPPTSPVPETPAWALLLAGLAAIAWRGRRSR